jgi:hypothetical protein
VTAIERANELTQQAIAILLAEREKIDAHLAQLGYGKDLTLGKKRGRPAKNTLHQPSPESEGQTAL